MIAHLNLDSCVEIQSHERVERVTEKIRIHFRLNHIDSWLIKYNLNVKSELTLKEIVILELLSHIWGLNQQIKQNT